VKVSLELAGHSAAAIEAAGFDACFVTDHPAPKREWVASGGHHAADPFVELAFAAAATTTLRVHTHCLIPAYRNPVVAAHSAATLDARSDGRLIIGVALGYLEDEFTALGVPFAERFTRFDETIATMKSAWAGGRDDFELWPSPLQQPHPPIWVGGNSIAAMKRAIRHGNGWAPFAASKTMASAVGTTGITDVESLDVAIEKFHALAREAGRDPAEFDICFTPFSHPAYKDVVDPDAFVAEAAALAAIGVTWLAFHLPPGALAEYTPALTNLRT
jgi:probable F420-dependent oxidoreductase